MLIMEAPIAFRFGLRELLILAFFWTGIENL